MINNIDGSEFINDGMMEYSAEVLLNRAIPSITDGLKPVQRKILWVLATKGLTRFTKSASVVGEVMKVHAHGDSYPSIVSMTQIDGNLQPLITGRGSFGQVTSRDMHPASSRYTEVKISDFGTEMTKDLKKHLTTEVASYDGTVMLPIEIPVSFPLILIMQQQGIGVAYSTKIPSFNMREVANFVEDYVKGKKLTPLYPDFSTGGIVSADKEQLLSVHNSGTGKFVLQAKTQIIDDKTIEISELPAGINREAVIDKIVKLSNEGKLSSIKDVKDLSDLKGLRIKIVLKKGYYAEEVLKELMDKVGLTQNYSTNINVLIDGYPATIGVSKIVEKWVEKRKEQLVKEMQFDINDMQKTLDEIGGIEKIKNDIDEFINLVRFTPKDIITQTLKDKFNLTDLEVDYLLSIKLININTEYFDKKLKDVAKLSEKLSATKKNMENDDYVSKTLIKQVQDVAKKYGKERMTKIL